MATAVGSRNTGKTNSYPDAHDKDNFIRLHSAVQYICQEAIPCITDTIQKWHQHQKQILQPCQTPTQCAVKGKPKAGKSCPACVAWGNAVEAIYYKPPTKPNIQVPWGNVNPTRLQHDIVEVAKALVLRLVPDQSYNGLDDFDAASLLMLMMNFTEFHSGDASFYGRIKDVGGVRNTLSHMKTSANLFMEESDKKSSFLALNDLCDSLVAVYPKYFQNDMHQTVNEFKTFQVTTEMTTKVLEEKVILVEEDVNELRQELRQEIDILSDGMKKLSMQSAEHKAPPEDMADIINKLPQYGPRMISMRIHGNWIDDSTGNVLVNVLPFAHQLEVFSISLHIMERNTHNKIINAIQYLKHLTKLYIIHSPYSDDLVRCISNTMGYLPQLHELLLNSQSTLEWFLPLLYDRGEQPTGTHVQHHIKRSACHRFITRLGSMEKMHKLVLANIFLHKKDLLALLSQCQQRNYSVLGYSKHLFPEDIDASQYVFLAFT